MQSATWLVQLVDEPINMAGLLSQIDNPDVGAHAWFIGVTRRRTAVEITQTLFYDAHRSMAQAELERLASAASSRFGLRHLVIVHRLGEVPIGQASVVVGCSSPHRAAAIDALPWIMDELKKNVPIWKREHFVDGKTEWVHPK